MWYLIVAQGARIAVIWVGNRLARKIFKTVALTAVAVYLAKRAKAIEERERRYGNYTDTEPTGITYEDEGFS